MSETNHTGPGKLPAWAGPLALGLLGLGLMLGSQATFGLWEPWETSWAEIAREMRTSGDWFAPHFDGKPAARPLLPLWLIALGQSLGSTSELGMRLPMALSVVGGALALYAWLRRPFGPWRALLAAAAALACPLVLLGGTTLAGNGAFQGTLMITVAALGAAAWPPREQREAPPLWRAGLFGGSMALAVLAQGIWGLLLPLGLLATVGLQQTFGASTQDQEEEGGKLLAGISLGVAGAVIAALAFWARSQDWSTQSVQVLGLASPATLIAAGLAAGWGSRARRALLGGARAAATLAPPVLVLVLLIVLYQQQVKNDLQPGSALLDFLGGNLLVSANALPRHVDFDFWIRQIGFAAYPWTALLPFGFAWLLGERGDQDNNHTPQAGPRGLLAAWFVASVLLMFLLGSLWEHYLFPGAAAIGVIGALAASDAWWWEHLRQRPLLMRTIGFALMLTLLFLSKDLDRYPRELLGPLLTDGTFEAPEGFTFGRSLKAVRYGMVGVAFFYFMDLPALLQQAWSWWQARRQAQNQALLGEEGLAEPEEERPAPRRRPSLMDEEEEAPVAVEEEASPSWLELLQRARRPVGFVAAFGLLVLVFVGLTGFRWVPELSHHLSQKGLLEAYQEHAKNNERLITYQLGSSSASFYLSDVEKISSLAQLKKAFEGKEEDGERFFLVLPRAQLSQLNYEVRQAQKEPRRNIHVIDDRSSRFVLATNRLQGDEAELSPVAHAILPERPRPVYQVVLKDEKGERQYAQFDKRIQLIGYEVYRASEVDRFGNPTQEARDKLLALQKKGELPEFKTGEKMVIRYFFKVLRRVGGSKQIFLHVDYPGSRINGDHYPVQEQFPTNHWLPGDYVVDSQWLDVEAGSPSGEYGLHMGFFQGSHRMDVTPKLPQTRDDRVDMGKIKIKNF